MCSECSDWQNKNTAKCRPCQAKGAFRVRLFRAFITVYFFLHVRGKMLLLWNHRWGRVAYAYAKLFFRAGKRTLGLWVAACRDRTTAATLSQRSLVNALAESQEHSETSHRAFDVLHRVVAKHFDVDIRLLEIPSVPAKSLLRKWRSYLR